MKIPVAVIRALNPLVAALLRSPLHGALSGSVLLLTFTGRRSGRIYTTPVSYYREGDTVRCFTSRDTSWWRNLRGGATVTLRIRGEERSGRAEAVWDDPQRVGAALRGFLTQVPRDAGYHDVRLDASGRPDEADLERAAAHTVLVETQLD